MVLLELKVNWVKGVLLLLIYLLIKIVMKSMN